MSFWRRFRLYLLGVGLGLILVMIFFGSRDWTSWTPESRVLTAIDSSSVELSERAKCQLRCLNLEQADLTKIQANGKVDFSESNVEAKPCPVYRINSRFKERDYQLIWEVCESAEEVQLLNLIKLGHTCNCG